MSKTIDTSTSSDQVHGRLFRKEFMKLSMQSRSYHISLS